jgi:carboxymethylenebutenolidase
MLRRAFVTLLASLGVSVGVASAERDERPAPDRAHARRPHMPHETITISGRDGKIPAHVFTPPEGRGPFPAVLFFMDGRGIRPALFEMGERLARAGYYVLLPDLFYRAGPYEAPGPRVFTDQPEERKRWFEKYIGTVTPANARADTALFLDFLAQQSAVKKGPLGTTGYCMGGALSLAAAAHFPERVAAAASYHGGNLATDSADSPHRLVGRITGRVYVAGAIEDGSFPDTQRERLRGALEATGVVHTVETYAGARHGWVPPDSAVHDPAAAERHWTTLLALYAETLQGAPRKG